MITQRAQAILLVAGLAVLGSSAGAGPIETACNRSGREAANRSLCRCIQNVADQTLKGHDQRRAAKLFGNPDLAHKTWISKSRADDTFWDRYEAFSNQAQSFCTQG